MSLSGLSESGFSDLMNYRDFLLQGLLVTLELSAVTSAIALVVGIAFGLSRAYGGKIVNFFIGIYVDVMRSIPLLVVLIYSYFALPILAGRSLTSFQAAVLGISVWVAAYVTEAVRAGLLSIRTQQMQAGLALGMTKMQAVRRVVFPQAFVRMLPVIGSTIVKTVKDTALASAIATPELLRQSQVVATQTYDPFTVLSIVMVVYFLLIFPVAKATDRLYVRLSARGVG